MLDFYLLLFIVYPFYSIEIPPVAAKLPSPVPKKKTPAKKTPAKGQTPKRRSSTAKKTPKVTPAKRRASSAKKTPRMTDDSTEGLEGVSDLFVSPTASVKQQTPGKKIRSSRKSVGLEGLSRLMKTPKVKASSPEDLEGLSDLFTTPSADKKAASKAKTTKAGGNWMKSLAKAAHGKRKKNTCVEDYKGVPELFATPPTAITPETRRKSSRKSHGLEGVASLLKTPKPSVNAEDNFTSELFQTPHSTKEQVSYSVAKTLHYC